MFLLSPKCPSLCSDSGERRYGGGGGLSLLPGGPGTDSNWVGRVVLSESKMFALSQPLAFFDESMIMVYERVL